MTKRGPGAWIKTDIFKLWFHILVSTIPAAVIGVLADDWVEEHFYNYQMVSVMLILFGIAFILIENSHKGKIPESIRLQISVTTRHFLSVCFS